MSLWREAAEQLVARIHAGLPPEADLKARRKALKGQGYPAHQGTAWGRKMWGRVVREYLARYSAAQPIFDMPPTKLDMSNAALRAKSKAVRS